MDNRQNEPAIFRTYSPYYDNTANRIFTASPYPKPLFIPTTPEAVKALLLNYYRNLFATLIPTGFNGDPFISNRAELPPNAAQDHIYSIGEFVGLNTWIFPVGLQDSRIVYPEHGMTV